MENLDNLQNDIEQFNTSVAEHFKSPEVLATLLKTFTSHNITIEDWNTVIDALKSNLELTPEIKNLLNEIVVCLDEVYSTLEGLDNKLDKVNNASIVYGTDANGNQITYNVNADDNIAGTIPQRNSSGHVVVGTGSMSETFVDNEAITKAFAYQNFLAILDEASKIYATDDNGSLTTLNWSKNINQDAIVVRDGEHINVPLVPTNPTHATSKRYVDKIVANAIESVNQNSFQLVDIEDYPTIQQFLYNARGGEGIIYLYPIDTSDASAGYFQYIWESEAWLFIGKTIIDLSDYYNKTEANAKFVEHRNQSGNNAYVNVSGTDTLMKVSSNAEGGIMSRNSSGQTKVGDPTDDAHAANKGYVDTADATKVDKTDDSQRLYGTDASGNAKLYSVDSDSVGNASVVRRNFITGTIVTGNPTADNHAATKKYVDDSITSSISAVYRYKGTKTVDALNMLSISSLTVGDVYNVSTAGTLLAGNIQVRAGDNVAWTGYAWDALAEDIDWATYNDTFLAAGFIQAGAVDSVPENLTFDSEGNITNPNWTGNITLDYMSPPISDITISAVPETLTFDVTQDYDNMITNADWTGIMTITY